MRNQQLVHWFSPRFFSWFGQNSGTSQWITFSYIMVGWSLYMYTKFNSQHQCSREINLILKNTNKQTKNECWLVLICDKPVYCKFDVIGITRHYSLVNQVYWQWPSFKATEWQGMHNLCNHSVPKFSVCQDKTWYGAWKLGLVEAYKCLVLQNFFLGERTSPLWFCRWEGGGGGNFNVSWHPNVFELALFKLDLLRGVIRLHNFVPFWMTFFRAIGFMYMKLTSVRVDCI